MAAKQNFNYNCGDHILISKCSHHDNGWRVSERECSWILAGEMHTPERKQTHFDILASEETDFHCKITEIKETLFIQELKRSLNVSVSGEKLLLY